jgi:hypothetical protein
MPPRSQQQTEKFLRLLVEITTQESYEKLDGFDVLLPASIVSAAQFLPDIRHWQAVFPALFKEFPEVFSEHIGALFAAFRYNLWFIRFAAKSLGMDQLIERAMEFPDDAAYSFFVVLITKGNSKIELSSQLQNFLSDLAEKFADDDDVDTILGFLSSHDQASQIEDMTYDRLIQALQDQPASALTPRFQALTAQVASDPSLLTSIEPELTHAFSQSLTDGPPDVKVLILDFCLAAIRDTATASFSGLVSILVALLVDRERDIVGRAKECLLAMLEAEQTFVIRFMTHVATFLAEDTEKGVALLTVLHDFFVKIDDEEMIDYVEPAMEYLQPAFSSDVVTVRRIVLTIFVEFRYKIPTEFEKYMEQLDPKHQSLIDVYSSRRAPKDPTHK